MDIGWQLLVDSAIILLLIVGISRFRTPPSARSGNVVAALALACALLLVLCRNPIAEPTIVVLALLVGGSAGWLVAMRVNMIQIPAMVAFQHGAGGIAAFLISFVELTRQASDCTTIGQFAGILGIIIGAATFSGSMIASARLSGFVRQTPTILPGHHWLVAGCIAPIVGLAAFSCFAAGTTLLYYAMALVLLSILLGIVFSIRIGGADMPVLISFLNATAGLAASFCGILVQNQLLVAAGATVAASGSILTHVMCRAMNRGLWDVFVPAYGRRDTAAQQSVPSQTAVATSTVAAHDQEFQESPPLPRAVEAVKSAHRVIIIPGYGMALAHAQFEVVKTANRLTRMGKDVKFAIHPIAGRMPGHMHVLLAEAEADSDMLFDMREINPAFQETDLVLIVGACDVVNPAAIKTEGTPISGMPILAAHDAKQVLVCNLDRRPGYSGVENPLYTSPKTILLLGDAKTNLAELLQALE